MDKEKSVLLHDASFESLGIRVRIQCNRSETIGEIKEALKRALPGYFSFVESSETDHNFIIESDEHEQYFLTLNNKEILCRRTKSEVLSGFETLVRLKVAEFAEERVFIHAGVVSLGEKALIIPGNSFSGKTSLVAALIKRGALYYSDEYAVLDGEGLVHPFPKTLSIRGEVDWYTQKEYSVESLGGKAGENKIPVGMVLLTVYQPDARWKPKMLSVGEGVLEILPHVLPIRNKPEFCLKVLKQMAKRAIIVKTSRSDVTKSADLILDLFKSACS
jgi:hypothetical protein